MLRLNIRSEAENLEQLQALTVPGDVPIGGNKLDRSSYNQALKPGDPALDRPVFD